MLVCKSRQLNNFLVVFNLFFLALLLNSKAQAETISVGILQTAPAQKTALVRIAQEFEQANPGANINLSFYSDADFKVALLEWLKAEQGPDVITWQGGQRLYQLVNKNQVKDLSYLWKKHQFKKRFTEGVTDAVSLDTKNYAIPVSYYQWGFYYRESVFKELGISAPSNWEEFISVCESLKNAGITPITIGAKYKWTSAAWFDYLNLRINGLEYHQQLLQGDISFKDKGVKQVFNRWKDLLDNGYFTDRYNGWSWSEAMPFMFHKMAGMTLVGNFFAGAMPDTLKSDFRFFKFPIINTNLPIYEEAPLDLFMLPNYVTNNATIDSFLVFLASEEFQQNYNESVGTISPNIKVKPSADYFIQQGAKLLSQAEGVSQFFDRDTNADMAGAATAIFTDFMDHKDVNKAVQELEVARQKYLH